MSYYWIHGLSGKMGQSIKTLLNSESTNSRQTLGGSSRKDPLMDPNALNKTKLIFDFSGSNGNKTLLDFLKKHQIKQKKILIGSTGLDEKHLKQWEVLATKLDLAILLAPNTSLGILVLKHTSQVMNRILRPLNFDLELTETHHRDKQDTPSGTALMLGKALQVQDKELSLKLDKRTQKRGPCEIGIHALRGGGVYGEHTVHFLGELETLSLSHRALDRRLFAQGAILLGKWLEKKTRGFYDLDSLNLEELSQLR